MASNTNFSIASWGLALDAALNVLNGGYLLLYSGTQPATPDAPLVNNTLLATLALSATAFAATSNGTKTANAISPGSASASGTITWFRAVKSDGVTAVIDGSVGLTGCDIVLSSVSVVGGANTVNVATWSVSMPIGQ